MANQPCACELLHKLLKWKFTPAGAHPKAGPSLRCGPHWVGQDAPDMCQVRASARTVGVRPGSDAGDLDKHLTVFNAVDNPPVGPAGRVVALPGRCQRLPHPVRVLSHSYTDELHASRCDFLW